MNNPYSRESKFRPSPSDKLHRVVRVTYPAATTTHPNIKPFDGGLLTTVTPERVVIGVYHGRTAHNGSVIYEDSDGRVHVVNNDIVEIV